MPNNDDVNKKDQKDQLTPSEEVYAERIYELAAGKANLTKEDILDETGMTKATLQRINKKMRRTGHDMTVMFTNFKNRDDKTDKYYAVPLRRINSGALVATLMHELSCVLGQYKSYKLFMQDHPLIEKAIPGTSGYCEAGFKRKEMMEIMCDPKALEYKRHEAEVEYTKATRQMARIAKKNPDVRALDPLLA